MDFYKKLPRDKKEFALFIIVISLLSVNIIAPVMTCLEFGFSISTWANALKVIPLIWLSVIALVLLTFKPAEWLTHRIVDRQDSFGAQVTVNILCTVFLMSIFLTVIGTWIGNGRLSWDPIRLFFYKWPRNFTVSFAVEALVAQPFARVVMVKVHHRKDRQVEKKTQYQV